MERGGSATSSSSLACMTALVGDQQLRLKKRQAKFGNRNVRRDAMGVESNLCLRNQEGRRKGGDEKYFVHAIFCPRSGSAGRGGPSYGR